jgi:Asp/Glu/hydantoin racemase
MNKKTIAFIGHYAPHETIYRETLNYLERFPDVELKLISGAVPPFPKSVHEITLDYLMNYAPHIDEPFFKAMEGAQKQGFMAAVTASFGDFGTGQAQKKLSIPCIGMAWANYTKARDLAGTFSVLHTHIIETVDFTAKQVELYGFSDTCVSVEHLDVDIYQWLAANKRPDLKELAVQTLPTVKRCAGKGAKAVVIGCGSPDLSKFANILNELSIKEYSTQVLAPIDTAIQVARDSLVERQS